MPKLYDVNAGNTASAVRALSALRPGIFALHLAADWSMIAAGAGLFLYFGNLAAFLAGSVLVGFGQHGLAVLGHEAVHYRVCENKRFNDLVGNLLCLMPLGMSVGGYRVFHLAHHRDTFGDNDPELVLRRRLGKSFLPPFTLSRGVKLWALSAFGMSVRELVLFAVVMPKPRGRELALQGIVLGISLVALGAFAPLVLALWGYALVTTFISKLRVGGWYEHGLDQGEGNRYEPNSIFFRVFVPHQVWMHHEHHRHPSVPFYNLAKLRAIAAEPRIYTVPEMVEELSRLSEGEASVRKAA